MRRALGDDAQTPRFVETLPRRGYRFLAEVDAVLARPIGAPDALATPLRRTPRFLRPVLVGAAALLLALQVSPHERRSEAGRAGLPSLDPVAQEAFQQGRRLLDEGPGGWRQSVAWFEEAARRDAGFALARYGLADAYMRLGENGVLPPEEAFPAARRAALETIAIEERAEPLVILAALELNYDWDWPAAERTILRAMTLDPQLVEARLFYARLLSASARHAEALRVVRKGEGRIVLARGGAAPAYLRRFDALEPAPAMDLYIRGSIRYLERLASTQSVTPDDFARLRAHLGDRDLALDGLRRAADERSPRLLPYLADPAFDSLRSDPRFQALVLRVRVPTRNDRVG